MGAQDEVLNLIKKVITPDHPNMKASLFLGEVAEIEAGLTEHPTLPGVMCPVLTINVPLEGQQEETYSFVLGSPGVIQQMAAALGVMVLNATYLPVLKKEAGLDDLVATLRAKKDDPFKPN